MSYCALYRTYRPKTFSEVFGQESIIKTIKNQIINDKVGHAYLFIGTRGTGKTSIAKIFSRAINCPNQKDGEPCNSCDICIDSLNGSLTDIVEMDAASNNSVEDIRLIREEVNFLPTRAKYRIYIIDEVHMLSIPAFNALLKTLEEPPEHVKFILATTEPHKIPATILSRCQKYNFKKISIDNIIGRLEQVCDSEKISYTKDSLRLIASLSDGALRDGLSILDRVLQSSDDIKDVEKLRDIIGIPSTIEIGNLIGAIFDCNIDDVFRLSNTILENGKEVSILVVEIIKYLRDILILKSGNKLDIYSAEELELLKKLSNVSKEKLVNYIFEFSKLENKLMQSDQKIVLFQAGLIYIMNNKSQESINDANSGNGKNPDIKNIEKRILNIENYLKNLNHSNINKGPVAVNNISSDFKKDSGFDAKDVKIIEDAKNINKVNFWQEILQLLKKNRKMVLAINLAKTSAKLENDNLVGIYYTGAIPTMAKQSFSKRENVILLKKIFSQIFNKDMEFKIYEGQISNFVSPHQELESLAKDNKIDVKIDE